MSVESARLKFICRLGYGDALPKDENIIGDIPVYGSNGQYSTTATRNTGVPAIVVGRKGSYGKVNWAPDGCFASDTTFFIDNNKTNSSLRWLYWALQTLRLDEGSHEAAVPGLNRETVYEQRVLWPCPETQRLIAGYLDRQTTHIDALVEEKEKMLSLLEEKRAALISRAVTRGLDPNAPLKPSGLDWLGDIPAHWEVVQVRFVSPSLQTGPFGSQLHAEDYIDNGIPVINPAHLKENQITPDYGITVDNETANRLSVHKLQEGDVVFARRGELGRCGVVTRTQTGWLCGTGSLRVRCDEDKIVPSYLALLFNGTSAAERLTVESVGSTMDNMNTDMLGHFRIPRPPVKEQQKIMTYIEALENKRKILEQALVHSIELAKKRRSSLISTAVTGNIPIEELMP